MSFDTSRFGFHPWHDYFGVVMQQGRVQIDADWNEWVAQLGRRLQAGSLDTLGRAVVPRTTPQGFLIEAAGGVITIGQGRIYVDGLLAENHGKGAVAWDAHLAEPVGSAPTPFFDQPYLPFNTTAQAAPASAFNRPATTTGRHLVYLDVWQRELTHLQAPDLIEKAVGVDTTGRLQTVWQVKLLSDIGNADCATPDADLSGWTALTRPSGARLSNSVGTLPGQINPCLAPPSTGYTGLENQLYRVEVHRGGNPGTATFKWSRDNATVATRVLEIHGNQRLVVESLGRDDLLGFHDGEWIEILDDWHELHGLPGRLHRIRVGDGVDAASRSVFLESALPAGLFPVDGQNRPVAERHTRIRRWDQTGLVRRADGSTFHDLQASGTSDGIPVPPAGTRLALENGILIDFSLIAGGAFKAGDHWVFAARSSDGSIEPLDQAPPRGIHHHYARLAVVTLPDNETDCRVLWPPQMAGEGCDCTVCVHADAHNDGTATIQQAIDTVRARGGGTVCLDVGTYRLRAPLNLRDVRSLRLRGQGWRTLLQPTDAGGAIEIERGVGVTLEHFSVVGAAARQGFTAMIGVAHSVDVHLSHLTVAASTSTGATAVAIGLGGVLLSTTVRDCVLAAEQAVASAPDKAGYLMSANLSLSDNVCLASETGVALSQSCFHYGQLRIENNLLLFCRQGAVVLTGSAFGASNCAVAGNAMHVSGPGVVAGLDRLRIHDNEIVALISRAPSPGILLTAGADKSPLDAVTVSGNRLSGMRGDAMQIAHPLGSARFSDNTVDNVGGGGLIMLPGASADSLRIDSNRFTGLGIGFNNEAQPFFGILLLDTRRAEVVGNHLHEVARQAVMGPLRAGIMAMGTLDLRVAGNQLTGIGPLSDFSRFTAGIAVAAGFKDVTIEDNRVERVANDDDKPAGGRWQALLVLGTQAELFDRFKAAPLLVPGVVALAARSGQTAYVSAIGARFRPDGAGSARVRGNRFVSRASLAQAADVVAVRGCLFDQNDIEVHEGDGEGLQAGRIVALHANMANNRFTGSADKFSFELRVDKSQFAVLGNLRSAPILVNGTLDDGLPPPWNTLNVTI